MASVTARLGAIYDRHGRWIDSLTGAYDKQLGSITSKAKARTLATIQSRLTTDSDGRIAANEANQKILRGIEKTYRKELKAAGLDKATVAFTRQFPGQIGFFEETLKLLNTALPEPLPLPRLSARDTREIAAVQVNSIDQITDAVEIVAKQARQRALLQIGAVGVEELAELLSVSFDTAAAKASTLAETAISTYYRTVTDRGYQAIEKESGRELLFEYTGPEDKLTRPFCRALLKAGKAYTRTQIDAMKNGQLPNAMRTNGGYRCRHQWILAGYKRGTKTVLYGGAKAA
jgi:hypothetical protein